MQTIWWSAISVFSMRKFRLLRPLSLQCIYIVAIKKWPIENPASEMSTECDIFPFSALATGMASGL